MNTVQAKRWRENREARWDVSVRNRLLQGRARGPGSGGDKKTAPTKAVGGGSGEGSRGGKIIGHTGSGKPIYADAHASHDKFSAKDHKEAAVVHGHSGTEEQRAWHMAEAGKKKIVTPQVAALHKSMTPFAMKK